MISYSEVRMHNITLPSNSDAIIYNDYGSGTSRRAIKHILLKVWWEEKKGINVIQSGLTTANSTEVLLTERKGYLEPQDWQRLTIEEALSGNYYTLQNDDRMIKGNPIDAPLTFESTQRVDQHFTSALSHVVMSVDTKRLPGGEIHHHEIGCR